MDETELPTTEKALLESLRTMTQRQYIRRFGVDRDYAQQLEAFGKRHPEFLITELLRLTDAEYDGIEEKIRAFYAALTTLAEDEELRIKLTHSSLSKTF